MSKTLILFSIILMLFFLTPANAGPISYGVDPIKLLNINGKTGVQFYWEDQKITFGITQKPEDWAVAIGPPIAKGLEVSGPKATKGQYLYIGSVDDDTLDNEDAVVYYAMFNAAHELKKRGKIIFDDGTWQIKGVGKKEWNKVFPFDLAAAADFKNTFILPEDNGHGNSSTTQVPEPATMLLLGMGLIGLAGYGRKRFKG